MVSKKRTKAVVSMRRRSTNFLSIISVQYPDYAGKMVHYIFIIFVHGDGAEDENDIITLSFGFRKLLFVSNREIHFLKSLKQS